MPRPTSLDGKLREERIQLLGHQSMPPARLNSYSHQRAHRWEATQGAQCHAQVFSDREKRLNVANNLLVWDLGQILGKFCDQMGFERLRKQGS